MAKPKKAPAPDKPLDAIALPPSWLMRESPLRITLIGVGGTGSMLLDGLASLHTALVALGQPGFEVTAYDGDVVSKSNLGRQRFTESDIGLHKSIALVHRINSFYDCQWKAVPVAATPDDARGADLVITCVDSAAFRFALGERWASGTDREVLWLDLGNGAENGQCILAHLGGAVKSRIPNAYDLYKEQFRNPPPDDLPSCSMEEALTRQSLPVNRAVADHALSLLHDFIRRGSLPYHGIQFQLHPPMVAPMPVNAEVWSLYGYSA